MIFHITLIKEWDKAVEDGFYSAPSLLKEGFIHLSQQHQVKGVLERYYQGVEDLVLLSIDESQLVSKLKYEFSPSVNEEFPHLYGPINLDAVVSVRQIL